MKSIVFLLIFHATLQCVYSQIISIKDKETQIPMEMVTLQSENPKLIAITNVNGQADISEFKTAERIEINALGYKSMALTFLELESIEFAIFMESSAFEFTEIVVSASRWRQLSKNSPSKITSISKRDVSLQNPQTAADLLSISGEVFVQKSQQGGGSPMIRGFSTNRLLYAVDGVRMNSAIFRAGNIQNVISLDPFAIENTEVLFGPGSVIYGSDAIGGVMSFQTLTPQFSLDKKPFISGSVNARYSSANHEKTGHMHAGMSFEKWAFITSLSYTNFGDLKMGTNGPDEYLRRFFVQRVDNEDKIISNPNPMVQNPTGYDQINIMQKIRFSPNKHWDFQYGFHYSETSEYSRYDRLIEEFPNGTPRSAVWNYGPQKWMMNNMNLHHNKNNILYDQLTIRVTHQSFEESRIDRNYSGDQRFRLRTNLEKVQAYSLNTDFEKNSEKHNIHYGLEFIQNNVQSTGSAVDIRNGNMIDVPDRYPASVWKSYAAYANYHYELSDKLLLQGGLRFSIFKVDSDFTRHLEFYPFDFTKSSLTNSTTTGSLGAVYKPDDSWKISINGSTGFRAPNIDDTGKIFDFTAGEVVVPNTSLKAEYAYSGEINISKIIGQSIKLDFTFFNTRLDHAMVRREFKVAGQDSIFYDGMMSKVYAIQNAAFGAVHGINFGFEIQLPSGFSLSSRYNYQSGKEEMDSGTISPSRHAAPAFGVTRLMFKTTKLLIQLYAMYSSEVSHTNLNEEEKQKPIIYAKDVNGNPYSPGWYTLNLKAMYSLNDNLSFNAGIENLADQRYRPYSSGLVAPGRNVIFSTRLNF